MTRRFRGIRAAGGALGLTAFFLVFPGGPALGGEEEIPPGARTDRAGGLLRHPGEEWTILNSLSVWSWNREEGWKRVGTVGEDKKKAVRNAVEAFNRVPGLRLKLKYEETGDPGVSIERYQERRDQFVIYWALDAGEGGLTRPFSWHPKSGYKGGTSVFVKNAAGEFVSERTEDPAGGPLSIAGAAIFAREGIKAPTDLARCKTDAPYFAFLHEVGHALGLGHATPGPSIMRGSCGMEYLPKDLELFRRLYGR